MLRSIPISLPALLLALTGPPAPAPAQPAGSWKELPPIPVKAFGNFVTALAFSPDGKTLATGHEDHGVRLWEVKTRKEIALLKGHRGEVRCLAFAPDGQALASGSADGYVRLWDVAEKKERWTFDRHIAEIKCLRFSPDGKMLASGSADKSAKLIGVANARELRSLHHPGAVFSLAFSAAGTLLAVGGVQPGAEEGKVAGVVKVWELPSGRERRSLEGYDYTVVALGFSADARVLTTVTGGRALKVAEMKQVEVASGKVLAAHKVRGHPSALSPDGTIFAARLSEDEAGEKFTSADGSLIQVVQLWDVATGKPGPVLGKRSVEITSLAFSADGKTVALGSNEKSGVVINLWTVAQPK